MKRPKLDRSYSTSAREAAKFLGCHFSKVEKIRKIIRDGWPEIQEAVANDEMSINKAYQLVLDREMRQEEAEKKASAAHIKAADTLLSEENFAFLEQLGGDVSDHVNKALEMYKQRLQEQEDTALQIKTE
jgi:hypothetical protein